MDEAFSVANTDGYRLVTVRGDIDEANATAFRLACASTRPVLVDLLRCSYIDSSGLNVLIASNRNGSVALILGPASRIYRIFEITQLLEHFRIAATVDEALCLVGGAPAIDPSADASDL